MEINESDMHEHGFSACSKRILCAILEQHCKPCHLHCGNTTVYSNTHLHHENTTMYSAGNDTLHRGNTTVYK